jgi:hypothetical protein
VEGRVVAAFNWNECGKTQKLPFRIKGTRDLCLIIKIAASGYVDVIIIYAIQAYTVSSA